MPRAHRDASRACAENDALRVHLEDLARTVGREPGVVLRFCAETFGPIALVGVLPGSACFGVLAVDAMGSLFARVLPWNPMDVMNDTTGLWASVWMGIVLVWLGALVGVLGRRRAIAVGGLQASLAAKPPASPSGPCTCRLCGAALAVKDGDLAVSCTYCRAQNLVAIPARWVSAMRKHARTLGATIEEVRAAAQGERTRLVRYGTRLFVGLFFGTLLSLLMFANTIHAGDGSIERAPRDYVAHRRAHPPRWLERGRRLQNDGWEYSLDTLHPLASSCADDRVDSLVAAPSACDDAGCSFFAYVALERGESVDVCPTEIPEETTVEARSHEGSHWSMDEHRATERDPDFGPVRARGSLHTGRALRVRAPTDAFYRLLVRVPGARPNEGVPLRLVLHRAGR